VTFRRSLLVIPFIAGLIVVLYLICIAFGTLVGLPWDLGLPRPLRLAGVPFVVYGFWMVAWVMRFRTPAAVVDSTYVTFFKLLRRMAITAPAGRTEPLVVAGPYRFVRHPLYSGVDGLTIGIALLVDHPWAFLGALLLGVWFAVVLAPLEERELRALFGVPYEDYLRTTRRFLPLRRRV
jgi:hypothetical protein